MQTLDWMIVPPVIIGAVYMVARSLFGKSRGKKTCGCSGCGEAGNCPGEGEKPAGTCCG